MREANLHREGNPVIAKRDHTPTFLPNGTPEGAGLDADALDRLVKRCEETGSDALVVVVDGRVVLDRFSGNGRRLIEEMSVTKSVVALAVGSLLDDGRLESLDVPVHRFYPEWRQGRKKSITVRHLLEHTSGLQNVRTTDVEIYPSPDFVQLALAAELVDAPGERFSYNNKAVNLIAGIVQRASGVRMDHYIAEKIFEPLDIRSFEWALDSAGNPHAMSGLRIQAHDLAKLGQLLLDDGVYKGRRVISRSYLRDMLCPCVERDYGGCGLLWWLGLNGRQLIISDKLLATWRENGVDPAICQLLEPMAGRAFADIEFKETLSGLLDTAEKAEKWRASFSSSRLPPAEVAKLGELWAYWANGDLGQWLVVVPSHRLVVVRQKSEEHQDQMSDFIELVEGLIRPSE